MKSKMMFWLINDLTVLILIVISMMATAAVMWFLSAHGVHIGDNLPIIGDVHFPKQ